MISSSLRSPMIRLVHLPSFSLVLLVLPMPLSGKRLVILVVWNDYENKVAKFNTTTQEVSEVGNSYNGGGKWSGGLKKLQSCNCNMQLHLFEKLQLDCIRSRQSQYVIVVSNSYTVESILCL